MTLNADLRIEALDAASADTFFVYLDDHLRDNGSAETGYFQPLSRLTSGFPPERKRAFREGLLIDVGQPGWRRAWVARADDTDAFAGHVDLRAPAEQAALHRCLLGMGVDRVHRRAGLGRRLLAHAQAWAAAQAALEWLDLTVLSRNEAALQLYRHAGFTVTGEVPEMYRLDGRLHGLTAMSRRLGGPDREGVR